MFAAAGFCWDCKNKLHCSELTLEKKPFCVMDRDGNKVTVDNYCEYLKFYCQHDQDHWNVFSWDEPCDGQK